ncbi:hypothetical protein F5887DRAFT_1083074 [Amanita rubescens]|nr:hypothetical protein F5887DRAFT_1083074 [Amanita rubescens]
MAAHKFFVGGNFKMNPTTQSGLESLVKNPNQADLYSNTYHKEIKPHTPLRRSSSYYSYHTYISYKDTCTQRYRGMPFQGIRCLCWRDQAFQKQLVDVEMRSKPTAWAILGSFDYLANQGHCQAERRTNFGETWETVAQKVRANGLKVILCILKEREEGRTTQVVEAQFRAVVKVTKESDWSWMKLDS